MRKSHVLKSTRGTFPSCSTGHFSVSDCPGGNRPSPRRCCSSFLRSLLSPKITVVSCRALPHGRQSPDWRPKETLQNHSPIGRLAFPVVGLPNPRLGFNFVGAD